MSIIAIIKIVAFLIKYGPALFSIVQEVIDLLKKLKDPQEAEGFRVDLERAVAHYRANGDRRPLEALRERLRARCFSGDCPK